MSSSRKFVTGNLKVLEKIIALLDTPKTTVELAAELNKPTRYVWRYLEMLHRNKEVYISGWHPRIFPIYTLGKGVDVPRPVKQTENEKSKRFWERVKADPQRHEQLLLARRKYRKKLSKDIDWREQENIRKRKEYYRTRTYIPVDPFAAQFTGLFGKKPS